MINDLPIGALDVDDPTFFLIPRPLYLADLAFWSRLLDRCEEVVGALPIPEDDVVIRREAINIALEFVVVVSDDFIKKMIAAELLVQLTAEHVANMPVAMDENTSSIR